MFKPGDDLRTHTNSPVFLLSGSIMIVLVAWASVAPQYFSVTAHSINGFITTYFGWLYILSTSVFLVFVVAIAAGRCGSLRQARTILVPDSRPFRGYR